MILRFNNLGIIEKAEIDISKPFILFTGPNGTGKTYLSYVLSSLESSIGAYLLSLFRNHEEKEKYLQVYNPYSFQTTDEVSGVLDPELLFSLFEKGIASISNTLLQVIGIEDRFVSNFSIEIASSLEQWKEELLRMKLDCGFFLQIHKESGTYDFKVRAIPAYRTRQEEKNDQLFELSLFFTSIFFSGASSAFMLTAERSGIAIFSKEISIARLKGDERSRPRYPYPISEGLAQAEDRAHHKKYFTPFKDLADEIENSILKGRIKITGEGDVHLVTDNKEFRIALTSSTTKALADFVFYLRHRAQKMSKLLVDEPEIHLHPNNQIILARLFAKMVNRGLHLVVSTHSDYIIREINNMVMMSQKEAKTVKSLLANGTYEEDEYILPDDLAVYYFDYDFSDNNRHVKVEQLPVDASRGFSVKSIDTTIENQNRVAGDLFYGLKYGD